MDNPTVSAIFGTAGAVCWSVQLLPQIFINWRRGNATGLKPAFMMFWAWAGVPLGIYNIVSGVNLALWIQPQILTLLSLLTWAQVCCFEKHWSIARTLAVAVPLAGVMAGIEAALIYALRVGVAHGIRWPLIVMAVLAAVGLALGVMEQYLDIWKHRSVRGISFLFVGIDALGDLTSIISVVFLPSVNALGLAIYSVELALWTGIFACGGYYHLIPAVARWIGRVKQSRSSRPRGEAEERSHAVSLHELPSSTSVFRTASGDAELRSRAHRGGANSITVNGTVALEEP